jgi:hypothetical protein
MKKYKQTQLPLSINTEFPIQVVFDKTQPYLSFVTNEPSARGRILQHQLMPIELEDPTT